MVEMKLIKFTHSRRNGEVRPSPSGSRKIAICQFWKMSISNFYEKYIEGVFRVFIYVLNSEKNSAPRAIMYMLLLFIYFMAYIK